MNEIHKKDGKFGEKKSKRGRRLLGIMAAIMVSIPIIGQIPAVNDYEFIADWFSSEVQYVAKAEAAEIEEVTPSMLEEMRGDVLDRLKNCENKEGVALIFDSNAKASIGDYMWQISSVQSVYFKKEGVKLSQKEAARLALDDVKARELAAWRIFEDIGVDTDWVNCSRKHGLQTLVDFIKAHSK